MKWNLGRLGARLVGLVLLALTLASNLPVPAVSAEAPDLEGLEPFVAGVVNSQLDRDNIAGATVSVVQEGEIVLAEGYGYSDLETRETVDPEETMFRIGSTSKLFTWTAIMQLVEEGTLDLDADINQYLDFELPEKVTIAGTDDGVGPITLRHLMTHTPGFEDVAEDLFVLEEAEMLSLEDYLKRHRPARVFPPGEVMAYSNYGTALAGYIVEQVSGEPFARYVEKNILEPLEMEHSTFRQPLPPDKESSLAQAYTYNGGKYHQGSFEFIAGLPAGSMSASGADMARFMLAHLQEGVFADHRIMEAETAREMHRQQFTQHPETAGMALGFMEYEVNGQRVIGHGGDTTLFHTGLYLLPQHEVGLFVSFSGGDFLQRELLFQAFMDRYFPGPEPSVPEPPADAGARVAALTGEYQPNRSSFTAVEKVLGLMQSVRVDTDTRGGLVLDYMGQTMRFAEVEPGLYRNVHPEGANLINTLAFDQGPGGRTVMAPGGPMTYTQAPWYGSLSFLGLLTAAILLVAAATLPAWAVASIRRRFHPDPHPAPPVAVWGRVAGGALGALLLVFVVGVAAALTDIDPAHGVPRLFFGMPTGLQTIIYLGLPKALLAASMVVFTVLAWRQGWWTPGGRLHYTLFTAAALGWVWVMIYTNIL